MEGCLYFIISYSRFEKENDKNFYYIIPEDDINKPKCIYSVDEHKNDIFYYNKVFKVKKSLNQEKDKNLYYFEFKINDDKYKISFDSKGIIFIYDLLLQSETKLLLFISSWETIEINLEYYEKLDYFIKALEKNDETDKLNELYKETLKIYEDDKSFSLLISLFVKIYQNKELCSILLNNFKQIDKNKKINEKKFIKDSYIKEFNEKFNNIKLNAEKIIDDYKYNIIEFYAIILCYYNVYNYKYSNYSLLINELFKNKEKDLFEILLNYNIYLINPIDQNFDIFNKFIEYIINTKDFQIFKIGLSYIKDLEIFINIIDIYKEKIYEKYITKSDISQNYIIKIDKNVKFKKEVIKRINDNNGEMLIIDKINSIIDFFGNNKCFLIYFTNDFWSYVLNCCKNPKQNNIVNCFRLRDLFIKYYNFVIKIFSGKDESSIKTEVINYYKKDEFSKILNQIIIK